MDGDKPHQSQWCWIRKTFSKVTRRLGFGGKVELYTVNCRSVSQKLLDSVDGAYLFEEFRRNGHTARSLNLRKSRWTRSRVSKIGFVHSMHFIALPNRRIRGHLGIEAGPGNCQVQ